MSSLLIIAIVVVLWALTILATAMLISYYCRRLSENDRYELTQLVKDVEEDPLSLWYALEPDPIDEDEDWRLAA